jgi:2'-5' RNA ligase
MIGYWLIPADEQKKHLASLIGDLARKYNAPVFAPHVTVFSSADSEEHARDLVERVAARHGAVELSVSGIAHSEKFTKTVFLEFNDDAAAQKLSDAVRESSHSARDYEFDPHLSLLYADLPQREKSAAAEGVRLAFDHVVFDSLAAIQFSQPIKSRADVEAWRTIATAILLD